MHFESLERKKGKLSETSYTPFAHLLISVWNANLWCLIVDWWWSCWRQFDTTEAELRPPLFILMFHHSQIHFFSQTHTLMITVYVWQHEGDIKVLYQATVIPTLTNKKWASKELAVKAGEKLDVIMRATGDKLICRNEEGKCAWECAARSKQGWRQCCKIPFIS